VPADPLVVVGASLAGLRAAESLRHHGYDGTLIVVGEEPHHPYDRPPLSKRALTEPGADIAALTRLPVPQDLEVEWRLGVAAVGLDLDRRRVSLSDGDELAFAGLVIATGATPRSLPGVAGLDGVGVLRSLDDAVRLRRQLEGGPAVVVIGAGFIGLEVAASCRQLGLETTVLEYLPVPLERAIGAQMGAVVARSHTDNGVDLRFGVSVEAVVGTDRVEGVRLADGSVVPADVVVVGIGVAPEVGWLSGSGLDLADGVICDDRLRVCSGGRPVDGVVAAGDVARWAHPGHAQALRLEHWTNAVEQGEAAGRTLLHGDDAPVFAPVPYFWSDQYGRKLQFVGHTLPDDQIQVVDGALDGDRWVVAYGRSGRLVAGLGQGRPARVMGIRRSIEQGSAFPLEV
jgi:3-phenylpropionate/trans-cinnamate dioxygenase ferredoxin reductase component